ncbi:MAG TPA: signal peptide peptidase SppA [Acidobacteriota bacterium]|nr:signal peptide peptidase SppA [Acidobacteriota bacterium]
MKSKTETKSSPLKIVGVIAIIFLVFIGIGLFFLVIGLLMVGSSGSHDSGNVALISISGPIYVSGSSGLFAEPVTSSESIVEQIKDAAADDSVVAIMFEINSPGGSGVASDEIAQAIRNSGKPTISYIREVGASGAYWVASATDKIYANRFSTVGSIGVIASYIEVSHLLTRYNMTYQRFVAGDNKDFGTPFREPTASERKRFQAQLDQLHTLFIEEVAYGRNLDESYVRSIADGFVWTGQSALDAGLIDEIGGKDEAVQYIEDMFNISVNLKEYYQEPSFLEMLGGFISDFGHSIGLGIGEKMAPQLSQEIVIRT